MNTVAQTSQSIQSAVRECFALCFGGSSPVDEIGKYCSELRAMGWDEPDILNVEVTVRRMLVRVIDDKFPEDDAE